VPGLNWHPTRNLIVAAFGSEDPSNGKGAKLHLIDLDTDKVERIPHQDTSKKYVNPDFSPDGTRIYFSRLTK
jgi:Tol biopolymer transport system component